MNTAAHSRLRKQLRRLAMQARLGLPLDEIMGEGELGQWVEAAHTSSEPSNALVLLANFLEESDRLRRKIRLTLMYPRILLWAFMLQALILGGLIYPVLANALGQIAPPESSGLLRVLASPLPGLVVLVSLALPYRQGLALLGRSRQLPQLYSKGQQALWCRALAHLLRAQRGEPQALRSAASALEILRSQGLRLADEVARGSTLSAALARTDFDQLVLWGVEAGENRQQLPEALEESAQELELEVTEETELYVRWLQPASMVALGILILLSLLSFWLPYCWFLQAPFLER